MEDVRIRFAPADGVVALASEVSIILKALKDISGISGAFVSDDTLLSDFGLDNDELISLGAKIGLVLDPSNDDDWWLVRVAARLRGLTVERN